MKPKAVLISDIHFTVATLDLATAALKQVQKKANELKVPLIIAGDTLDSKAIMRGEVVNRLISLLKLRHENPQTYILVGNHDLFNEKSTEHTLNFLEPYCVVVDRPCFSPVAGLWMFPYINNISTFLEYLNKVPEGSTIIMHQGVQGADMGHYVLDKTSLPTEVYSKYKVISGHYHKRQNIDTVSYIGNPYTLGFGEADHPSKGFQILMEDGSLEFVPTNLRKHIILEAKYDGRFFRIDGSKFSNIRPEDMVWIKYVGPRSVLNQTHKSDVKLELGLPHNDFKLDLIPTDSEPTEVNVQNQTNDQIFDFIIDTTGDSKEYKTYLKQLWRELVNETHKA